MAVMLLIVIALQLATVMLLRIIALQLTAWIWLWSISLSLSLSETGSIPHSSSSFPSRPSPNCQLQTPLQWQLINDDCDVLERHFSITADLTLIIADYSNTSTHPCVSLSVSVCLCLFLSVSVCLWSNSGHWCHRRSTDGTTASPLLLNSLH